jgi:hypothetical protein
MNNLKWPVSGKIRKMGKKPAGDPFTRPLYKPKPKQGRRFPNCVDCGAPKKSNCGTRCPNCAPKAHKKLDGYKKGRPAANSSDNKGHRLVIEAYGNIGRDGENKFGWSTWLGPFFTLVDYNTDPDLKVNCAFFRHKRWTAEKMAEHFFDHVTKFARENWSFRLVKHSPKLNKVTGKYDYIFKSETWLWPDFMVNDNKLNIDQFINSL